MTNACIYGYHQRFKVGIFDTLTSAVKNAARMEAIPRNDKAYKHLAKKSVAKAELLFYLVFVKLKNEE